MNRFTIGSSEANYRLASKNLEMALEAALTRNLEIPIGICIAGIVYLTLLNSVIWYLE